MALLIENLRKNYIAPDGAAVQVLNINRFHLNDGEQVALLGGSGTGKTTLLHAIAGIIRADSGRVVIAPSRDPSHVSKSSGSVLEYQSTKPGFDLTQLSEAARDVFRGQHIGYIFQTHHLLAGFTAMENVLLGMTFTGRKPDRQWAKKLLVEVGLGERLDYKPAKLSVGQQQRVAVARALANRPSLVLADEPTGALDPTTAQQVLDLIRKLCKEINASLILVTHDMSIATQLERVVKLEELNQNRAPQVSSNQ